MALIYKCNDCGFSEEYINHIPSCRAPENCPDCGSENFNKSYLENFKGVTFFDPPGGYAWEQKVKKINNAITDPRTNHNSNPY